MVTCVEASYGDRQYLNYKKDLEGHQSESHATDDAAQVCLAIFGLGRIGTIHLENLRSDPRAHIRYCVEASPQRANFVRNKWRLLEPETTFLNPSEQEVVYNDSSIDAVIVCTPTFTHESIVLRSIESGKAVFCEKPLSLDRHGIERCLEASKKHNKPILCAFNRRFDPGLRCLKDRVQEGDVGSVQVIKTCSRDSPKPPIEYLKISGGIFHDCAVHDIDLICWIVGQFPNRVTSYAHTHYDDIKEIGDHDTVAIMMHFQNGAIGIIDLSRHAVYGYDQRIEVFGDSGMLSCGEVRPTGVKCHNGTGTTAVPIFFSFASRYQEAYALEMSHFIQVVQGQEECEVSGESILAVTKIAEACEQSAKTGNTVTLNWDGEQNGF